MKFAHMADLHIGGWREQKISILTIEAFRKAVEECINQKVDFVIISGDIFNTSLPNIDYIKETTIQLKKLKDNEIPVYAVAGSHDFSPSGKTMLDVLCSAGLMINVVKAKKDEDDKIKLLFTKDKKTGAKITGMLGRKVMLEKSYYESLNLKNLEEEDGFKIFIFHTALDELKPEEMSEMESCPISLLPKGFDYYAGGHVHIIKNISLEGYKNVVYPGPLFPNSFSELEKLGCGGFFIYDNGKIEYKKISIKQIETISIDCTNKVPEQINSILEEHIKEKDVENKIVLIRIKGKLSYGKSNDINIKDAIKNLYLKKAYFVMKNTAGISTDEFQEIKSSFEPERIEEKIINEHLGQIKIEGINAEKEKEIILKLISALSKEKNEGETKETYEQRIRNDVDFLD